MNETPQSKEDAGAVLGGSPCSRICFLGGPLDGLEIGMDEWPETVSVPGTEILNKPTGSLYRYHLPSSTPERMAYTYRAFDSANTNYPEQNSA